MRNVHSVGAYGDFKQSVSCYSVTSKPQISCLVIWMAKITSISRDLRIQIKRLWLWKINTQCTAQLKYILSFIEL